MLQEAIPEAISEIWNSTNISDNQLNHPAIQQFLNWCQLAAEDVQQTTYGLQEYFISLFNQINYLKTQFNELKLTFEMMELIFKKLRKKKSNVMIIHKIICQEDDN